MIRARGKAAKRDRLVDLWSVVEEGKSGGISGIIVYTASYNVQLKISKIQLRKSQFIFSHALSAALYIPDDEVKNGQAVEKLTKKRVVFAGPS